MFDRIKRSFYLVLASAKLLRQDNCLLLFPVLSAAASLLVVAAFALPLFGIASIDGLSEGGTVSTALLFYVVQYVVIFYFNTALVGAALLRLDGGKPTLGDGLRIANARIGAILGYAVISATVGVILRAIQERVGFIGRLIVALVGAGWTVATFLVVPAMVVHDRGTFGSISESVSLLKRTWGENLAGQVGLDTAFGIVYFVLAGGSAVLALLLLAAGVASPALFVAFVVVAVLGLLACVLCQVTLNGVYSAVLYRYAAGSGATPGFGQDVLETAFYKKS